MSVDHPHHFIHAFRQSAPYINTHRKKTFVIHLDGHTLQQASFSRIVHDIALLKSLGIRIVLVYGTKPQIDAALEEKNIAYQSHLSRRITSHEALEEIKQVSGKVRLELEAQFSNGLPNTPMFGANIRTLSGNLVTAKPMGVIEGRDFQFTGTVRRIDVESIELLLNDDAIVLLPNIAFSATGECFNIAAEEIAVAAAQALCAEKLIVFTHDACLKDLPQELLPEQAQQILEQQENKALSCIVEGCLAGIERNHLISYEQDGALLLELFSRDGAGVLLSKQAFETTRAANITDVGGILELLEPLEQQGVLVKRERELLEQEIAHFIVVERDGIIIACSALYPYQEAAEIACVVTHPDYRGGQHGKKMLNVLQEKAADNGIKQVFVLTTQSAHFFLEQGFRETSLDQLPTKKKALYNFQRKSKVFSKRL